MAVVCLQCNQPHMAGVPHKHFKCRKCKGASDIPVVCRPCLDAINSPVLAEVNQIFARLRALENVAIAANRFIKGIPCQLDTPDMRALRRALRDLDAE